jgi:membrane protease subunit HflK
MPWTNQPGNNGSGDNPRGPWGRPPSGGDGGGGGRGIRPPDFEGWMREAQDRFPGLLPGGLGQSGLLVAVIAVVGFWLLSGTYIVEPSERGIVLRFGKFVGETSSGINYHLPWPIETAYTPNVTAVNQINIGYRTTADSSDQQQTDDVPDEALMLTGDENIVDVHFAVYWKIKDAAAYLFNVANPPDEQDETIKAVAESAMREVVGQNPIAPIMTSDRETIQIAVRDLMQKTLDLYNAGVLVTSVQMQKVDPPEEVRGAYLDVQRALTDQDTKRNDAERYANKIIPQARGKAAQIVQDAEGYRQRAIAEAGGEAKRFLSVYEQYKKAPEVTRKRMYLETMSSVLGPMNKVIVDDSVKGVVPYFQLPSMLKPQAPAAPAPAQNANAPQASSAPSDSDDSSDQSSEQGSGQ